jgi:hypothetical protein
MPSPTTEWNPNMNDRPLIEDVDLGTIEGARMMVTPKYQGVLTEDERRRMLASATHYLIDATRYDAEGATLCAGTDCTPDAHDLLGSFRRECVDVLSLALNFALVPSDMPELVRAVGAAVGIEPAEVERLVDDLGECVRRYKFASGVLVTGGDFIFGDDEHDDDLPKYVSLAQIVRARYAIA